MTDDSVRAPRHQAAIRGSKAEGAAKAQERHDTDDDAEQLDPEPDRDSPLRMSAAGPQEHDAERATERQEPITRPSAHRACSTADQVGNDHPRLLAEEHRP